MNKLFLIFLLFSINLYPISYQSGIAIDIALPLEFPLLKVTSKCVKIKDVNYNFRFGITFKNKIKVSDSVDLVFDISYNSSIIKIGNESEIVPSIDLSLSINKNINKEVFLGVSILRETILFRNEVTKGLNSFNGIFPFSLSFDIGYQIDNNYGISLSNEVFKFIDTKVKKRGYFMEDISSYYYF